MNECKHNVALNNFCPDCAADGARAETMVYDVTIVGNKTLDEWRAFARRDDCLDNMLPSDLRALIARIK